MTRKLKGVVYDVEAKWLYQHVVLALIGPKTIAHRDIGGTQVYEELNSAFNVFDKADLITAELLERADAFAKRGNEQD
jgi:hypothetical protein